MTPAADVCRRGQPHIWREWTPETDRCAWCGAFRKREGTPRNEVATNAPTTTATECCGGSETRQRSYPRPTITERHDERTIEERFNSMRVGYEQSSTLFQNFRGNR